MKKFYFMIFAVVTLAGMLAISGCKKDESTAQDDALGNQGTLTVSGIHNGHEFVDLGLPSGLLWATCNVGANNPEAYGDYFAWGETTPKDSYTEENYTYSDNPETLPASADADAATANWGSGWRMPTQTEMQELIDNCTWEWTTQNGVNGRKFTGPNGNTIFLLAAGYRYGSSPDGVGSYGFFWSSSLRTDYPGHAWYLGFFSGYYYVNSLNRGFGLSVRPVCVSQN